MNYYIQGNKERADEIKAAFEAKGCVMHTGIQCDLSDMVYYSLNGKVGSIKLRNLDLFKSHPNYKELELSVQPKFKVGDWVVEKDGEPFANGNHYAQITNIAEEQYWFDSGSWLEAEDIRLWTIDDAKDGDVLVDEYNNIGLYSGEKDDLYWHSCIYFGCDDYLRGSRGYHKHKNTKPATKEQRDLLFSKMKELGYEWDANKKKLRKIKPHYDISNFNPFDKVLVRQDDSCTWGVSFFGRYAGIFICCSNVCFTQCIPFDGNEHLLGTTDMCDEMYINW